jgi:hypothetical protein
LAFVRNGIFHIALRALRVTFFVLPKNITKEIAPAAATPSRKLSKRGGNRVTSRADWHDFARRLAV